MRKSDELRAVEVELRAAQSEIERLLHKGRAEHYEARLAGIKHAIKWRILEGMADGAKSSTPEEIIAAASNFSDWLYTGKQEGKK